MCNVQYLLVLCSVFIIPDVSGGVLETELSTKVDTMVEILNKVESDLEMLSNTKLVEIEQKLNSLLQFITTQEGSANTPLPASSLEGILVVGGLGAYRSAEVFIPATGKSCPYPDVPFEALGTTLDSVEGLPTLCGHNDISDPSDPREWCVQLTPPSRTGEWKLFASTLEDERKNHMSWVSSSGLVLMGDGVTELVPYGGKIFDMKHLTSYACTIPDKDSVILTGGITGGVGETTLVERYNLQGLVEKLPSLNEARYKHGCGSYTVDGKMVLLVAGGKGSDYYKPHSSTEILSPGSTVWSVTKPLPRGLGDVASVTLGNQVYIIGGTSGTPRVEVLTWDGKEWKEVGQIKKARYNHSATKIVSTSGEELCL